MLLILLFLPLAFALNKSAGLFYEIQCENKKHHYKDVVTRIIEEISQRQSCIFFVTSTHYRNMIELQKIKTLGPLTTFWLNIRENENFFPPRRRLFKVLSASKAIECNAYVILNQNGLQTASFLRYVEQERLVNARGLFLLLYDIRLFSPDLAYLWNRIVNVIFIRAYDTHQHRTGQRFYRKSYDLYTVHYPVQVENYVLTKYTDTFYNGKFRYDVNHFPNKVRNLQSQTLRIAVFEHVPAVTKEIAQFYERSDVLKLVEKQENELQRSAMGIEFELINIIARAMNFNPLFYQPYNVTSEKWGNPGKNGSYSGLLGEIIDGRASFLLGDLHNTARHLQLIDLSTPYNAECLTFITPETFTENSWKLLILPFQLNVWIGVSVSVFSVGLAFHLLAVFYKDNLSTYGKSSRIFTLYKTDKNIMQHNKKYNAEMTGMELFTDAVNSFLYTFSMLVQVSLPRIPRPWSLRVLIGFWWTFSLLVAFSYRASLTAALAQPVAKLTIDTFSQLANSDLNIGGWGVDKKQFFKSSDDSDVKSLGNKFEIVDDEEEAITRVINGTFAYYESTYFLQHMRALTEIREKNLRQNKSQESAESFQLNLHIMEECAVTMPVSIGMDKNSPLKSEVDKWVKRVVEAGLVERWLSNVMAWSRIKKLDDDTENAKAIVDMRKLHGAIVALIIGYCFGFVALLCELIHFKYVVKKNPDYDKYNLIEFYRNQSKKKSRKKEKVTNKKYKLSDK